MMSLSTDSPIHAATIYTVYPWEHALVNLRITAPLQMAGVQIIHGNEGGDIHPELVLQGDIVVIQREFPEYMEVYEQIVALARQEGKPLIYETDDLLLELPEDHPDQSIHYYTPGLFPMLRAIIEADLVTTSTLDLLAYLRPLNPHICLLPNYLDDRLWQPRPVQDACLDSPLIVGYMGSNTHQPDIEPLSPVIRCLLERYAGKVLFKFWSVQPPQDLRDHASISWQPLAIKDYSQFAAYFSQQEAHIFIAPLKDTFFNRCKSPIKFFDYSILGIPGVYGRVAPYEQVVKPGVNGFLASSLEEWEHSLAQLIENPELRRRIGLQAQQDVIEHWRLSQHAQEWLQAYQQAFETVGDAQAQQIKQEYTQIYVRVARQVRRWQNELRQEISHKNRQISTLEAQIAEKDAYLQELHNSTAWKLIQKLWQLRLALSPRRRPPAA